MGTSIRYFKNCAGDATPATTRGWEAIAVALLVAFHFVLSYVLPSSLVIGRLVTYVSMAICIHYVWKHDQTSRGETRARLTSSSTQPPFPDRAHLEDDDRFRSSSILYSTDCEVAKSLSIVSIEDVSPDSAYESSEEAATDESPQRSHAELVTLLKSGQVGQLSDADLLELVSTGATPAHALEKVLNDTSRAVQIRRGCIVAEAGTRINDFKRNFNDLPWKYYDYNQTHGCCAENVIGYTPVPVGLAGPLIVDGNKIHVPMTTTEGTLIASTSRGCKALNASGGAQTEVLNDAMTRAPVVCFASIQRAAEAKRHLDTPAGQSTMKAAFDSTTHHGQLQKVSVRLAGRHLYLRFVASTGEAMGMNMISKGVQKALQTLQQGELSDMQIISISGNYCTDKKPSAVNWIEGRGKSVVAGARIPAEVVESVLKTTVKEVVRLHIVKNYVGSALAGTATGGFNAHAANIVAAVFLATGQDIAQVTTSSNCITILEELEDGSLYASVTMPSLEVGTVGGGTRLPAQRAMLRFMGCNFTAETPGVGGATKLARIIAATTLAGELSLCAALSSGDLVRSHMIHNRKTEQNDR